MIKRCVFIVLFCMLSAGCSFHLRSAKTFPPSLRTLYFSSVKPNSLFSIEMRALLRSMNVTFVKAPWQARFSMLVTQDHFAYSRPDIVDTTLPTTIGFSQVATVEITQNCANKGKSKRALYSQPAIVLRTFTSSDSLTLNTNQIYTANANDLMRHQLNRQLTSLVYYWLISDQTKQALDKGLTCKSP